MLKTIKLYGVLGKKFGKEFHLAVESTREAVKALSVQVPGFEQFMLTAHEQGLAFAVFQDDENISEDQIDFETGAKVIKIVPKVIGAGGNGVLQTILGAVMVVVGVVMLYIPGAQPFAASVIGAGIGMMVGGIAQMMMPKMDEEIKTKTATGQTRALVEQSLQSHKAIQFRFFMVSVKSVDLL